MPADTGCYIILQLDMLDDVSKVELPYPYEMVFRLQKGRERGTYEP